MGYYGDLSSGRVWFIHKDSDLGLMPTAIFIMYTSEGFAFGADGRQCRDDRSVFNDEAQKIFPIDGPKRSLGYALAGTVLITDQTNSCVFDFTSQACKAVEFLATRKPDGLEKYSREFAFWLYQKLRKSMSEAKAKGAVVDYPDIPRFTYEGETGSTIARLFLAGYYNSIPGWTQTRFFHVGQNLKPPTVYTYPIAPGGHVGYGSSMVNDILNDKDDPRFSRYRSNLPRKLAETTLSEAIEITTQTIMAQSDPHALEIDPDVCSLIGGRIHIARLTKTEGFHWVIPPLQLKN